MLHLLSTKSRRAPDVVNDKLARASMPLYEDGGLYIARSVNQYTLSSSRTLMHAQSCVQECTGRGEIRERVCRRAFTLDSRNTVRVANPKAPRIAHSFAACTHTLRSSGSVPATRVAVMSTTTPEITVTGTGTDADNRHSMRMGSSFFTVEVPVCPVLLRCLH